MTPLEWWREGGGGGAGYATKTTIGAMIVEGGGGGGRVGTERRFGFSQNLTVIAKGLMSKKIISSFFFSLSLSFPPFFFFCTRHHLYTCMKHE